MRLAYALNEQYPGTSNNYAQQIEGIREQSGRLGGNLQSHAAIFTNLLLIANSNHNSDALTSLADSTLRKNYIDSEIAIITAQSVLLEQIYSGEDLKARRLALLDELRQLRSNPITSSTAANLDARSNIPRYTYTRGTPLSAGARLQTRPAITSDYSGADGRAPPSMRPVTNRAVQRLPITQLERAAQDYNVAIEETSLCGECGKELEHGKFMECKFYLSVRHMSLYLV
jgi:hypothetical protein